ncbi:hypothetical protein TrRE_jg1822, partial [Triparma retinervis]
DKEKEDGVKVDTTKARHGEITSTPFPSELGYMTLDERLSADDSNSKCASVDLEIKRFFEELNGVRLMECMGIKFDHPGTGGERGLIKR